MHDLKLELGEKVEPAGLLMAEGPLLLEPLQARVIRVQLEGLVEEIRAEGLEAVQLSAPPPRARAGAAGMPAPET